MKKSSKKKYVLPQSALKGNLILVGPRAAGKSKTTRHIHHPFGLEPISTDLLVSYESRGKSIADYVAKCNGDWRKFRELEYRILNKVCRMHQLCLDTGGGILVDVDDKGREILSKRKQRLIKKSGLVVYLHADLDWIWSKIAQDHTRPALNAETSFQEMMKRRHPWYQSVADISLDTTELKGREIAEKLTAILLKQ